MPNKIRRIRRKLSEAAEEAKETKVRRRTSPSRRIGDRRNLKDSDEGVLHVKGFTSGHTVPGHDPQTLTRRARGKRIRGPKWR